MTENLNKVLVRGFTVWLIIILAESLHGIVRVMLLEPTFGDFKARQIAVFSGMAIILTISFLCFGWLRTKDNLQLFIIGVLWLILTLSFEILLGRFVMNLTWERILSDYNILNGGFLPIGLVVLTFAPLIAKKLWKITLFQR
jgi:hypothetical protein